MALTLAMILKRARLIGCAFFLFLYASSSHSQTWVDQFSTCGQGAASTACNDQFGPGTPQERPWRLAGPFSLFGCAANTRYVCQTNGSPCTSQPGTVWDQNSFSCACPPGQSYDSETSSCEDDPCPDPGTPAGTHVGEKPDRSIPAYCYNNCQVILHSYFKSAEQWVSSFEYTGQYCSSGSEPEPDAPEPDDPENIPNAGPTSPNPTDSDGDGTPDGSDPDIDGDGTPNETDPDIDGDGVPNSGDKTPNGEPEDKEDSSATTDDDCLMVPQCSGDAIECAQLMELWRLRCLNDESDFDESKGNEILNDFQDGIDSAVDGLEDDYSTAFDIKDEFSFHTALTNAVESVFPDATCSDIVVTMPKETMTIKCSDTLIIRQFMAVILGVWACITIFNIAREPVVT